MNQPLATQEQLELPDPMTLLPPEVGSAMATAHLMCMTGYYQATGHLETDKARLTMKILWGRELGLGPVASITGLDEIDGKLSPSSGLIASRIDAHPRYTYVEVVRNTDVCRLAFYAGRGLEYSGPYQDGRAEDWLDMGKSVKCPLDWGLKPGVQFRGVEEFTIADAQNADLTNKRNWKNWPRQMLFARAITEGQRSYCPDLWGGGKLYSPDELGQEEAPAPEPHPKAVQLATPVPVGSSIDADQQAEAAYHEAVDQGKEILEGLTEDWDDEDEDESTADQEELF